MNSDNESPSTSKSLRDKVLPTLVVLRERFPQAFLPEGEIPRPLQVGILQELFVKASDISRRRLRWAVYYYANNIQYQQALLNGGLRYDLEGQPMGEVTDEHREAARDKLKELKPKEKPRTKNGLDRRHQKNYQSRGKSRFPYQNNRSTAPGSTSSRPLAGQTPAVVVRQRKTVSSTVAKTMLTENVKSSGNRGVLSLKRRA